MFNWFTQLVFLITDKLGIDSFWGFVFVTFLLTILVFLIFVI